MLNEIITLKLQITALNNHKTNGREENKLPNSIVLNEPLGKTFKR